ncbi:AraC family transcriptional regulator [Niveispirillum fermenti]|uniref:AraC family transcriptional regulator n=1 Tax=Niveispirillum fermenti TaxID=1233113 RepID=UPI003A8627AF
MEIAKPRQLQEITLQPEAADRVDGPIIMAVAGTVEAERFSVPLHRHGRGQLMASMRGLLAVDVGNEHWVVPASHTVWVPPGHLHTVASHGVFQGWSVFVAECACLSLPSRPRTFRTSALLREAVLRAAAWSGDMLDTAQQHIAAVILDEVRFAPAEALGLPLPAEARLMRIARAFITDPSDGRDLDAWAAWAAVSPRTLSRRFVQETGFTFTAWRQRVRLLRALEMLAAGEPVTTVAMDLGYSTTSAFIGLFRKAFGITPAAYRRSL